MIRKSEVTLHCYTKRTDVSYNLPADQQEFTMMPQELIKRDAGNPEKHLIVIRARGEVAGFFELDESADRKRYSDNPKALLLRGYSVNPKYQGRGIATGSLEALPAFMQKEFEAFDEIVLGVNARNTAAQNLYKKAGFEDTGRRVMGKKGEQFAMCLKVE
ncbi:GNAT family N-acetyltransferase [Planococcus maitriensis]|uniref:N-acetyltransferase n=1 Tax=Planococcus maitriensis TaxID=221799 RepID=A0A365KAC6_9BACL|nr:N-acetyltransferase [Planococcus maitriensis]RAZ69311.1 N-acetyltransferase [Planococcus maitriensis]